MPAVLVLLTLAGVQAPATPRPSHPDAASGHQVVIIDKPGGQVAVDLRPVNGVAFSRCVDAGKCARPSYDSFNRDPEYAHEPAMSVTWHMARAYCAWVGRRLPTLDEYQRSASQLQFPGCCARGVVPREWVADEPQGAKATQVRARLRQGKFVDLEVLRLRKSVGYDSSTVRCAVDVPMSSSRDSAPSSSTTTATPADSTGSASPVRTP
ncbi:MAG: SUMF1/EgtB/PvdO family nonheme iron enzyme [Pseudomonadota bacterium]